jgi:hypothetical protein
MHEDYVLGVINDDAMAKTEQINVPCIVSYKNFDERKLTLELTYDRESIFNFIKAASTPSVVEFHSQLHFSYESIPRVDYVR